MPLYDYYCTACEKASEISHRMADPPVVECPLCGQPKLVKQMSPAGFRLKGAGWYETDFKSGNKRNLAGDGGGDSKPAADAKPSGDAKPVTESKPAESKPAASSGSSTPASTSAG